MKRNNLKASVHLFPLYNTVNVELGIELWGRGCYILAAAAATEIMCRFVCWGSPASRPGTGKSYTESGEKLLHWAGPRLPAAAKCCVNLNAYTTKFRKS